MVDDNYKNAFKQVYDILENTEEELVSKIPEKFLDFLKENMNKDYETHIQKDVEIDKQPLLKETENILSLIYRSYWATEEEKENFKITDKQELLSKQKAVKNVNEIFNSKTDIDKISISKDLVVIEKESFIKRFFKKIANLFKKREGN